jgi:hypothetical protein
MYSFTIHQENISLWTTDKAWGIRLKYHKPNILFLPKSIVTGFPQENNMITLLIPNWLFMKNQSKLKCPSLEAKICKLK